MTGFATPPSTTCSTMYYDRTLSLLDGIYQGLRSNTLFRLTGLGLFQSYEQVQNVCNVLNLKIPDTSTIEDVTYTANMAYADFYPELLNEHQCIKYAAAVANDKDGYTGIQFCRWMADVVGKKEHIDWDKFK